MTKKITIFGGSAPLPGSDAYQEAQTLGRLLAERGYAVMTGGYIGTMEAASKGAAEAGGHVIGVTCEEIESWRPVRPNRWIHEEWRRPTLKARLDTLIESCDAALALPGGPGTLTEIMLTWNQLIIEAIPPKPLLLIGEGWRRVLQETFFSALGAYIPEKQRILLRFVPDVRAAVDELDAWNASA
jgi:uncharacterized protein (TIGR00730 family)